jgi:hypothetical protein
MRKLLIVVLSMLGFASVSHAQDFKIRFGPGITVSPGFGFGLEADIRAKDLAAFDRDISLGLYGNAGLSFPGGGVDFQFALGPTVVFDFARDLGEVYAGLAFGLAGGVSYNSAVFFFGFVTGVEYQVSRVVNLFANLNLIVVPGFQGFLDLGSEFNFSSSIGAFAKLAVGFRGSFGFGGGLVFNL